MFWRDADHNRRPDALTTDGPEKDAECWSVVQGGTYLGVPYSA